MKAVIMAGGKGTRLQPLTKRMPKPMLELLDRPMMEYTVELLAAHNFRDITMTVCYMADAIEAYFGDGSPWGVHIQYQRESAPLGTAGSVKALERQLTDTFLIASGDGLTDFDLTAAVAFHRSHGGLVTILLKEMACPLGYGTVDLLENRQIMRFVEKPATWCEDRRYLVNTGIYLMDPDIFRFIPKGEPYDFGREVFPSLIEHKVPIFGYQASGYWSDVGTLPMYYQAQLDMVNGRVNVNLPAELAVR